MIIAKNEAGKIIHILSSNADDKYFCACCGNELKRIFTTSRQYFKHPIGVGDNCEEKIKDLGLEKDIHIGEDELEILEKHLFNKEFSGMNTEISDLKSEEGYPLTLEQKLLINSEEDKIRVNSVAGSAKSTTLYYYAKARPHKRILYLVYNSSAKKEAEETFGKLKNVVIKTTHGLAYGYCGKDYIKKGKFKNTTITDIMDILRLSKSRNEEVESAIKISNIFKKFLLSESHDMYSFANKEFREDRDRYDLCKMAVRVFEEHRNLKNKIPVPHDFYLKMFHLEKRDLTKDYDIILLDEAQDSTMLIYDVIKNSNVPSVVMVGDSKQMLYAWRDCVDVLKIFEEGFMYELNTSFRVSNNIAYFSNLILNVLGKEDVNMKGFNDKNKMINHIDKSNPYTILFRNNASIIQHCFENVDEDRKVCFIGGYDNYKFNILLEAYEFLETGRTRNKDFQNFKNYTEMVEFAKKTDNVEIIIIDKLIELYGDRIPAKVKYVKENSTDNQNKAHIVISTGHRSKGSTIKRPLIIGEDFAKLTDLYDKILFGKLNKENLESIINELYLIYVVLTRGAREIEINEDMKKFFVAYYKLNKELFEDKNKMEEN